MKKRREQGKLGVFLGVFILTFLLASCTSTEEPNLVDILMPEAKEDVYVYDQDDILDENLKEEMNQLAIDLEEKKGAEFVIITVDSLEEINIDDYSYTLVNKLGIGKEEENGALLFISKSDNQVKIEVGKGLTDCLNDRVTLRILNEYFEPFQKLDDYDTATRLTSYEIVQAIMVNGIEEESSEGTFSPIILVCIFLTVIGIVGGLYLTGNNEKAKDFKKQISKKIQKIRK